MCENCVKYTKNNMVSLQEYYLLVDLLATSMGGTSGFSAVLPRNIPRTHPEYWIPLCFHGIPPWGFQSPLETGREQSRSALEHPAPAATEKQITQLLEAKQVCECPSQHTIIKTIDISLGQRKFDNVGCRMFLKVIRRQKKIAASGLLFWRRRMRASLANPPPRDSSNEYHVPSAV